MLLPVDQQLRRLLVGEVLHRDSQALYTLCSATLQKWLIQSDMGKARCVFVHAVIVLKIVEFNLCAVWLAVHPDCWCICLCYLHFAPDNPKVGEMYLLVPAHRGCPGQGPEGRKMDVCVCGYVFKTLYGRLLHALSVQGNSVELTDRFTYLGSVISSNGCSTPEMFRCIGLGSRIMNQLACVWRQSRLRLSTKLWLYNALVVSVLLYGAET